MLAGSAKTAPPQLTAREDHRRRTLERAVGASRPGTEVVPALIAELQVQQEKYAAWGGEQHCQEMHQRIERCAGELAELLSQPGGGAAGIEAAGEQVGLTIAKGGLAAFPAGRVILRSDATQPASSQPPSSASSSSSLSSLSSSSSSHSAQTSSSPASSAQTSAPSSSSSSSSKTLVGAVGETRLATAPRLARSAARACATSIQRITRQGHAAEAPSEPATSSSEPGDEAQQGGQRGFQFVTSGFWTLIKAVGDSVLGAFESQGAAAV